MPPINLYNIDRALDEIMRWELINKPKQDDSSND